MMQLIIKTVLSILILFYFQTYSQVKINTEKIDNILKKEVTENRTPSVQYLFFDKEKVIYRYIYGLSDVKKNKPISERSAYYIFSVTKTFTALAILQLAEQNKIDINKPAKDYLYGFTYSGNITIKNLLTHTSGIPNPMPLSWIHLAREHEIFNSYEFFGNVFRKHNEVKSEPNEEFTYSNLGYVLLGQIIENVSGIQYEQYIKENIMQKLKVDSTQIDFTINDFDEITVGYQKKMSLMNFVLGFIIDKSKFMKKSNNSKWQSFNNYYVNGSAYGGLIATPEVLVKYLQELMKENSVLLGNEFKKQLFTENYTSDNEPTGMCLSWFTGKFNGKTYFSHAGGGGGYYCEVRIYPDAGIGSIILFNRTGISNEKFLDKIDKHIINKTI